MEKLAISKQDLTKWKIEQLKPGDLAFHSTHGYVQLEKPINPNDPEGIVPPTDKQFWECKKLTKPEKKEN